MKLLLELETNYWRSNLPGIKEIAIIIPNKYNQCEFYNIL